MWRLAFVVIIWVLAGCHFVKGYVIANLDSLAVKQLDEYFELEEAQYDLYEMKIKNQLALVQKNQIPRVIAELEVLKNKDGAIPSQQISQWVHDKPRQIWLEIVDQVSIDAAMFLQGLKPDQRKHFKSKLKERQEPRLELLSLNSSEYKKEYADKQDTRLERLEEWLGELNAEQRENYRLLTFKTKEEYRNEIEINQLLREAFLAKIQEPRSQQELAAFLRTWVRQPDFPEARRYQNYRSWRRQRQIKLWQYLEASMTPTQRKLRREKIAQLIADLKAVQKTKY